MGNKYQYFDRQRSIFIRDKLPEFKAYWGMKEVEKDSGVYVTQKHAETHSNKNYANYTFTLYPGKLLPMEDAYCAGQAPGGVGLSLDGVKVYGHAYLDCFGTKGEDLDAEDQKMVYEAFDTIVLLPRYLLTKHVNEENDKCWYRYSYLGIAMDGHDIVYDNDVPGGLDMCNGAVGEDGVYRYYAKATFPYFVGCFRGQTLRDARHENARCHLDHHAV